MGPNGEKDARPPSSFVGLFADIAQLIEGCQAITIGDLVAVLGARGHGPIILVLAGLMMLPTGMLPFMPSIIGILLALTATEMIVGGKGVSLPAWLSRRTLGAAQIRTALDKSEPVVRRARYVLRPRMTPLVDSQVSLAAIASVLLLAAAIMIVAGAIPGLPFLLCVPVLLLGLGLTAGDGLVVAVGLTTLLPVAVLVSRLVFNLAGWL